MARSAQPLDAEIAAELAAIDEARETAFEALHEMNQRGLTGADADEVLAMFAAVDTRTAAVKVAAWPRYRGSLIVANGTALLVSPAGRGIRTVWERPCGIECTERRGASRPVPSPLAMPAASTPRGR